MHDIDILLSEEDKDLYNYKIYWAGFYPTIQYPTDYGLQKTTIHRIVARRMLLINLPPYKGGGFVVDHINGNVLDARRENLQLIKQRSNIMRGKRSKGSSKYLRVHFNKRVNKFSASIGIDHDVLYLGSFDDEVEAAFWADVWTVRLHDKHSILNFPDNINFYLEEAMLLDCNRPWQRDKPTLQTLYDTPA